MAARAAAFSDPEVREVLSGAFVPVAENCSYLQRQQDAEGDLFRLIAEQGHYGGRFHPTDSRQGMYVCAPDGRLLASCNVHGADRLLPVLRGALEGWPAARGADGPGGGPAAAEPERDGGADPRYLRTPPAGGLVLRVWSRDLPRPAGQDARRDDWRRRAFNLDHAWFTAAEAAAMVPPAAAPGAEAPWPPALARRIARYHLIDNVRGEPPMWGPQECEQAELRVRVTAVDGPRVHLAAAGRARLRGSSRWVEDFGGQARVSERGTDAVLDGELEWDAAAARFVRFDLLASGTRWGATQYNSRYDDPGPAAIGWAFELAAAEPGDGGRAPDALVGDRTPPQGIGAEYFRGK